MNKLKSFTLIEVIMALVLATMISIYAIKNKQHANFNEAIMELQDTVEMIINDGIIKGYASGGVAPCSTGYHFENLDDINLLQCMQWYVIVPADDESTYAKRFDIFDKTEQSNIIGNGLMENYGRCSVNVLGGSGVNVRDFDIYVDCSNIEFNNKSLLYVEDALRFTFENKLGHIHQTTTGNASSISEDDGDGVDGKIRARFNL